MLLSHCQFKILMELKKILVVEIEPRTSSMLTHILYHRVIFLALIFQRECGGQGLATWPRLALNSQSFCLSLLNPGLQAFAKYFFKL
jgi:hypothetical protein